MAEASYIGVASLAPGPAQWWGPRGSEEGREPPPWPAPAHRLSWTNRPPLTVVREGTTGFKVTTQAAFPYQRHLAATTHSCHCRLHCSAK